MQIFPTNFFVHNDLYTYIKLGGGATPLRLKNPKKQPPQTPP